MATQVVNIIVKGKDEVSGVFSGIGKSIGGKAGLAGALGKVGLVAGGAVVAGVGAAAAGMTAFAVNGIKKAANFEQQLADIAAVMGEPITAVEALKKQALDLGLDPGLKVSATEAAQAMELLARNGLKMEEITGGAARAAILLANATGADFGGAADVATDAMALWNIELANMEGSVDGITSVVTNSKFAFNDYRLALAQGGGVAAAVGVSFEDFNTTIAGIAESFGSGSDAGTSFKTFLQRLVPQSNKAIEAMADLGIITEDGNNRFFDAQGNMKGMADIAGILAEATEGLSDEQKNQAISTIFGTDAMRAALGIARLGKQGFADLQAQMGKTSAAEAVETRNDTLAGQFEILTGLIETLSMAVGDQFKPAMKTLVKAAQEFVSKHGDALVGFFGKIAGLIELAIPHLMNFVGMILDLGRYLFAVVQDGDTLNDWLTNLPAPIQPIVKALGEFITFLRDGIPIAIAFVKDAWERIFLPSIKQAMDFINGIVIPIFLKLVEVIRQNVLPVVQAIAGGILWLGEKFTEIRGIIIGFLTNLVSGMQGGLGKSSELALAFGVAWDLIKGAVQSALAVIQPIWERFVENFTKGASKFNTILPALGRLWEAIKPIVVGAIVGIGAAIAGLIGLLVGLFSGWAEAIDPFLTGLALIVEGIIDMVAGIVDVFVGLIELIIGIITGDGEMIKDAWMRLTRGLGEIWEGLVKLAEGLFTSLFVTIWEFTKGFIAGIIEFFEGLYDALVGGSIIPDLVARIIYLFFNLKDTALSILGELVWGAISLGHDMIAGLVGAIENGVSNVTGAIQSVVDGAINSAKDWLGIGSPSKVFADMGMNIGEGLTGGMRDSMAMVRKEAGNLAGATFGLGNNVPSLAGGSAGGSTNITVNIDGVSVSSTTNGSNPNDQAILMTLNLLTRALQTRGAA